MIDRPVLDGNPMHPPPPLSGMRRLAGGTYRMGADYTYPEEAPAHTVTVGTFWIDSTPSPMRSSPLSLRLRVTRLLPSVRSTPVSIRVRSRSCSSPAQRCSSCRPARWT